MCAHHKATFWSARVSESFLSLGTIKSARPEQIIYHVLFLTVSWTNIHFRLSTSWQGSTFRLMFSHLELTQDHVFQAHMLWFLNGPELQDSIICGAHYFSKYLRATRISIYYGLLQNFCWAFCNFFLNIQNSGQMGLMKRNQGYPWIPNQTQESQSPEDRRGPT